MKRRGQFVQRNEYVYIIDNKMVIMQHSRNFKMGIWFGQFITAMMYIENEAPRITHIGVQSSCPKIKR